MRRALLFSLTFAMAAAYLLADDPTPAATVVPAKLNAAGWTAMFVTRAADGRINIQQQIPLVRCYNADGYKQAERRGYIDGVANWVRLSMVEPVAPNASKLDDMLAVLTSRNGSSFDRTLLPPNQPVVVTFGAEWCAPCRSLEADLKKVAGITVIDVDVDRQHMAWSEIMAVIGDPSK